MGILHNAIIVTGGTLFSRFLGFARDASIAWLLGSSGTADALTAALRLPYMVRRLFGEGTLSLALTTACVRERLKGHAGLTSVVRCYILFGAGLLTVFAMLGAGLLIPLTAPGLLDRTDILNEAVLLFRICIPYILFALLASVSMAELHSRNLFLLPALAPALFNITVLLTAIPAVWLPPSQAGILFACGVLLGGLLQWILLLPPTLHLHHQDVRTSPSSPEEIHRALQTLPPGILGAAVPQLAFLLASALSSLLPEGHMSSLFYAERLLEFPLGILGAAVGMAATPHLATLAARSQSMTALPDTALTAETETFITELRRAQLLSLGLNLPAAAGLAAISTPLVSLILGHGAFTDESIRTTALALCAYAPGLPAYALSRPLLAACEALQDNQTPVRAALPSLLVTAVSGFLLLHLAGPWGPPLGVSFGLWCNVCLLRRGLGHIASPLPCRSLLVMLFGTASTFIIASLLTKLCSLQSPLVALALAIPAGVLVYGFILLIGDRQLLASMHFKKNV